MKQAARGLAGYGRYGDNNLVHVSNEELRGIEQLTGRKFTRNPDTGLPEAFNFSSLIPIVAGVAGTIVGGPVAGAAAAGLASAGVSKAEGKSTEEALTKGLISGVTSYAGGQLLSGVGELGGSAVPDALSASASGAAATTANAAGMAGQEIGKAGTEALTQLGTQGAGAATQAGAETVSQAGAGAATQAAAPGIGAMDISASNAGINALNQSALVQSPALPAGIETAGPVANVPPSSISANISRFGERVSDVASNPDLAISKIGSNIMASPQTALIAAGGTYAGLSDMGSSNQPRLPGTEPYDASKYPERFPTNPRRYVAPPTGYAAGRDPEYRYFAKGGLASMRQEGGMTENVVNEAKAALLGEHPKPQDALSRFEGMFGAGALEVLRDRITGGRVKGAGGGMDDLIPGTIEGRQKVRLADGEFVLPADIVSGIGDGSTDQGVRRLHEMMNRVRKERTGKTAQPKAIGGKISL